MENIKTIITTKVTVDAPIEKVWKIWTTPTDITQWNNCSADWHTSLVEVDLKEGGAFLYKMQLKDGSIGFDHAGRYDTIITNALIKYTVSDGRKSIITFTPKGHETIITEAFEPEGETPLDVQEDFCQKILQNFKTYTENKQIL